MSGMGIFRATSSRAGVLPRCRPMSTRHLLLTVALAAASLSACSDDDAADQGSRRPMTTIDRPDGPAAELTPLTAGKGINLVAIRPVDLDAVGYQEEEYAASGTATSYVAVGDLPADGTYELAPDASDDYVTRIVVRRPADPADFNGTVLVEWLNVTSGIDANPDWTYGEDEIVRGGYASVGVSAQA